MGIFFYLVMRASNIALQENNNFDLFNFLMGDNSVEFMCYALLQALIFNVKKR